jgi:CheY-like chemotaxis protein
MTEDKPIRTYLVIEDEPATAELLKLILRQGGAQNITIARSGAEGVELAEKEHPDLILTGIGLEDLSGYEVCKKLQADKKLRDIPVLLIDGIDSGEVEKAIRKHRIPAAGYLMLPFYPEDMIEKCHDALNGKYQWPRTEKKQDKKKEPAE